MVSLSSFIAVLWIENLALGPQAFSVPYQPPREYSRSAPRCAFHVISCFFAEIELCISACLGGRSSFHLFGVPLLLRNLLVSPQVFPAPDASFGYSCWPPLTLRSLLPPYCFSKQLVTPRFPHLRRSCALSTGFLSPPFLTQSGITL